MAKLTGWKIALIVTAVIVAVIIIVVPTAVILSQPTDASQVNSTPQLFPYGQQRIPSTSLSIPRNFSVWGFTFSSTNALAIDSSSGKLTIEAKAWNTNRYQRWTCALQKEQDVFNRGYYVIQNLGDSNKCLCADPSGGGFPTVCSPISTGNFNQQWVMITLSGQANATVVSYALVNRANGLALTVDLTTGSINFGQLDGTNTNQGFQLWELTVN